ncbi:MAG: hypothetical protein PHY93_02570 [Bacteriovorax sp.]|nr:hypothetical protein [Bacteriovorax sp.]
MNEIECVRVENASPPLDGYLKKLIKEVSYEVKFIDWKSLAISSGSPLILIADPEHLLDLKNLIASREQKIIVALNSRKDFKLVSELKSNFDKIFGFIDLSQEIEYNTPILNNYLNMNFSKQSMKLDKLATDLDRVYEFTKSELVKIKDLHNRFVKVRVDQLKGATLSSKFMAGEKSGGEFFEVIQNDQEILFIQAGSDSYLLSSMILSEIEMLKEKSSTTNLQTKLEQFKKVIIHHANENNAELTYCMMILNLKTLQASFTLKGMGYLFYQGELISFDQPMKLKLKPRDRLCVISQGAMKNWELLSKISTKKFFMDNEAKVTKDLINEFFFEVSRNKSGNFLVFDALMAVLEIEENVLYQLS